MIDVTEAKRILANACDPLEVVNVRLQDALYSVLAEEVRSDRDFPPTDRSAMDGFAVNSADLPEAGGSLTVAGEIRAGEAPGSLRLKSGEALKIFTGAIVPEGADAVVMVEDTDEDREGGTVQIRCAVRSGQHVRPRASDLVSGQTVLEPGTPIRAAELAALTSVGCDRPRVYRKPLVSVLSTGDEIVEPEVEPLPHQVRNSNGHTLLAQLREMGVPGAYAGIASDDAETLRSRLAEGLKADVLLVTGGVSVGEYDLVGAALERAGMRLLFHKVAMKPGKPILVGRAGSCLVFGLPGNPVSTFTGFQIFVAPALRRLMGQRNPDPVEFPAVLTGSLRTRPGRRTYHLAHIEFSAAGPRATPVKSTGSGDVLALSRANGFVITEKEQGGADAGASVPAMLWS